MFTPASLTPPHPPATLVAMDALRPIGLVTWTPQSLPAPARQEPRDGLAPTREGPPTFQEIRSEADLRARDLGRLLRGQDMDPQASALLGKVENLASSLHPDNTTETKRLLREALWELRQRLHQAPPEARQALEKLRNLALDHSWERSLTGFPTATHVQRPPVSAIPNYDDLGRGLRRGGQPDQDGVDWLVAHGTTIEVDLRGDDRDNSWAPPTWPGIRRYHIPMPDYGTPTREQVEEFARVLREHEGEKVFLHCKAGVGRTGTMVACWRITQGWSAEEAIARERFYAYGGSFRQEEFVRAFEREWKGA